MIYLLFVFGMVCGCSAVVAVKAARRATAVTCRHCGHPRLCAYCASCGKSQFFKTSVAEMKGSDYARDKRRKFLVWNCTGMAAEQVVRLAELPRVGEQHLFDGDLYHVQAKEIMPERRSADDWTVWVRYG